MVSKGLHNKEFTAGSVIIHEALVSELEVLAEENKSLGFLALDEIERLHGLSKELGFRLEFLGIRPRAYELRNASPREIDAKIRDLAFEQDGTLFTSSHMQARISTAKGISVKLIHPKDESKLQLESFFDDSTMSVHLRENVVPAAKKGRPGNWEFVQLGDKQLTRDEIQEISREILESTGTRSDSFLEIERPGSTIVQMGKYRIVMTRPPFADGWEITAVRPVKHMSIGDYRLSEKLHQRIIEHAEGILIAGSPGMGKSTFAQALAEYYAGMGKIVKTIEAFGTARFEWNFTLEPVESASCLLQCQKCPTRMKCFYLKPITYQIKEVPYVVEEKKNITEYRDVIKTRTVIKKINETQNIYTNRFFGYKQFLYLWY